ncbi:MAG TPA: hypothetical protein VF622_11735 [Segetibacter sp.]|jgi:hypothetical protein
MSTINLTRIGNLVKVEVDDVLKGLFHQSQLKKLNPNGSIAIGDVYATFSAITDIKISGVAVTDLADFQTKIATVFPEANSGNGGSGTTEGIGLSQEEYNHFKAIEATFYTT